MASLTNKTIASTYKDLLQVSNSNSGVDATLQTVEDGEGTSSSLKLSDRQAEVLPAADGTAVFDVSKSDGTSILSVDTTNSKVIATELDISGNVDIDGTTNLDAVDIDGEVNVGGNYIVHDAGRQNHVANTMPAPSMHFNADTYGFIDSNSKYDAGTNDFSIEVRFKLETGTQLFLSHISGWLVNGWVLRAFDGGSGSNVYRVRLDQDGSGIGTLDYMPNATWEFGKWVHAVFTFDRSGNLTIYQDGVSVGTTSITSYSGAISSGSGKFGLGTYTGNNAGSYKDVEISNIRWHNRLLSADEVKHYYSGGSVPFKYQGADNTHRVTANATAIDGSVSGASATAFELSGNDSVYPRGGWALTSNLEVGKTYKVSFTATSATVDGEATAGNWQCRLYTSSGFLDLNSYLVTQFSHGSGANEIIFTNTGSSFSHIAFKGLTTGTNFKISNFDIREIGCVIDLDPSGVASDKWLDKSGNDLHANMTNGAVHNAPTSDDGLVYEEGTFTPLICEASTTGNEMSMNGEHVGTYTRIGRIVHISINCGVNGNGSANNNAMAIKGLPYSCGGSSATDRGFRSAFSVSSAGGLALSSEVFVGQIYPTEQIIRLHKSDSNGNLGVVTRDQISTDGGWVISGTYQI